MNIFWHGYRTPQPGDHNYATAKVNIIAWRKALDIGFKDWQAYAYYEDQLKFVSTPGEWRPVGKYMGVSLGGPIRFGSDHIFYDGPHCSFSLGILHFAWSLGGCDKCMAES